MFHVLFGYWFSYNNRIQQYSVKMDLLFDRCLWNSVLFVLILLLVLSLVLIREKPVETREHLITDTSVRFCGDINAENYNPDGCFFSSPQITECKVRNNYINDPTVCKKPVLDEFRRFHVFENTVQKLFQNYRIIHYLHKLSYVEIDSTTRRMVVKMNNSYKEEDTTTPNVIHVTFVSSDYKHLFSVLIRVCLASLSVAKLTGYRPDEVVAPSMFSSGRITVPIPEIGSDEYFNLIQNAVHYTLTRRKMVDVLQGSTRDRYLENMTVQLGLQSPEGMEELKTRGLESVRIVDKEAERSQKKTNPLTDNRNTGSLLSRSEFGKSVATTTTNTSEVVESKFYREQLQATEAYIRGVNADFREAYLNAFVIVRKYQNFTTQNILDKGFSTRTFVTYYR